MASPSTGHIKAAKRVARYIKGTKEHGISFHSIPNNTDLAAYVKFPIENDILAMSDVNWGPQDASAPKNNPLVTLELFKTRSILGFLIWHHGPLHWVSKCQTVTT
eukprot:3961377-Ditylum_brightwellii.AAC.1